MQQLDRRIATLRLRLAEIRAREDQHGALLRQFKSQMDKIVDFAARDESDLGATLSMLDEVATRYGHAERALRHLAAIRAKAQEELDALVLTRSIEVAKQELAGLEKERARLAMELAPDGPTTSHPVTAADREQPGDPPFQERVAALEAEIRRLKQRITDASEEAARKVSSRSRDAR